MKNYIFRKSYDGFIDWIKSIGEIRRTVQSFAYGGSELWRKLHRKEYNEANRWYGLYLKYKKGLDEKEKNFIKRISEHHLPEWHDNVDSGKLYRRWLEIIGEHAANQLKEITNKEVGAAILEARKNKFLSRKQVADIIGINQETLKAYEKGTRALPFSVYYKLIQFIKLLL